jgi:hypothetical protein
MSAGTADATGDTVLLAKLACPSITHVHSVPYCRAAADYATTCTRMGHAQTCTRPGTADEACTGVLTAGEALDGRTACTASAAGKGAGHHGLR